MYIILYYCIIVKLLLALQRAVFWFIAVENDASKCVETFCYSI